MNICSKLLRITGMTATIMVGVAMPALADIKLSAIFGDNMVLQRELPIRVWGWAEPGEQVTVKLGGHEGTTTTDVDGNWKVTLSALKEGLDLKLVVAGSGQALRQSSGQADSTGSRQATTITLTNIAMGEVWVCIGQGNMEMSLYDAENGSAEVAASMHPNLRLFRIPGKSSGVSMADLGPVNRVCGAWEVCKPDAALRFSATAYYFGRELHRKLNVPVGLIEGCNGRIDTWIPLAGYKTIPELQYMTDMLEKANAKYKVNYPYTLDQLREFIPVARRALALGKPLPPFPELIHDMEAGGRPSSLYNGMIMPIVSFPVRGAIMAFSEDDRHDGIRYGYKTKALITGWREAWGLADMPFYQVQLLPFHHDNDMVTRLPLIWECQVGILTNVPNTGIAGTMDLTDMKTTSGKNKFDVGRRLSLWALAKTYGMKDVVYSGPLYKSMAVDGNKIRITFDHVGGGLVSRDGKPLTWFTITGTELSVKDTSAAGKSFVEAKAEIQRDNVLVWSDAVPNPKAVRFGWNQEAQPNLMNKEGLPALPFRMDHWN